ELNLAEVVELDAIVAKPFDAQQPPRDGDLVEPGDDDAADVLLIDLAVRRLLVDVLPAKFRDQPQVRAISEPAFVIDANLERLGHDPGLKELTTDHTDDTDDTDKYTELGPRSASVPS